MSRHHPQHESDIPISRAVQIQLSHASFCTGYEKEDWEIAAEAIDEWMRRHDPDAIPMPATKGYQWKSVFLPDGTLLRTVFCGKNYHCLVADDGISYNGQAVSPSGFVNVVGGIRRNAWRCTWILFPQASQWQLADTLRTRASPARPPRVRAQARAVQPPPAPPDHAARTPEAAALAVGPLAAPVDSATTGASEGPCVQPASHHQAGPTDSTGQESGGRQRLGMAVSPSLRPRGAERRAVRSDSLWPLLREQLLPLLHRMCAMDGERRGTGAFAMHRAGQAE